MVRSNLPNLSELSVTFHEMSRRIRCSNTGEITLMVLLLAIR